MTKEDTDVGEEGSDHQAVPQPKLETERLVLRPFREDDAETVQTLLQCREIAANTRTIEHPYPEGAAITWISAQPELWKTGANAIFAICKKTEPDSVIGAIGLELNSSDENAEMGYWIGEAWWGQGICSEAAQVLVEFGFSHFGLHKIHAHHLARNPASGRVLEKAGMEREGRLNGHTKKWGVFEDVVVYGILHPDCRSVDR